MRCGYKVFNNHANLQQSTHVLVPVDVDATTNAEEVSDDLFHRSESTQTTLRVE